MKAWIIASGIISPQNTWESTGFPAVPLGRFSSCLSCVEPDYQTLINPVQLRRMPRILKMGLAASQICIKNAGGVNPDAIIIGTGLGCLRNLEKFLDEIIDTNEQITSVLPFINSTHNAVAAQIAILMKNTGYNVTYCHRGFSFESALADSIMHIEENRNLKVLVGGIDELTDDFVKLHGFRGYWKEPLNTLELISSPTIGTIAGEGSAFFLLSGITHDRSAVAVEGVHTFLTPEGAQHEELQNEASEFIESAGSAKDKIDVVIFGINGDSQSDKPYYNLKDNFFEPGTAFAYYKHLCGEYHTSTAFAVWLGKTILETQTIPAIVNLSPGNNKPIRKLLIYNHYRNAEHSFILLGSAPAERTYTDCR